MQQEITALEFAHFRLQSSGLTPVAIKRTYHLTLFLLAVVTWHSYMGWFHPWPVGIGLIFEKYSLFHKIETCYISIWPPKAGLSLIIYHLPGKGGKVRKVDGVWNKANKNLNFRARTSKTRFRSVSFEAWMPNEGINLDWMWQTNVLSTSSNC